MSYSLSEAATATGKSRMTIQRAIKSGKVSASRGEDGSYSIDPAELHRVFPAVTSETAQSVSMGQRDTTSDTNVLRLQVEMLREQMAGLQDERDDLRRRLDEEASERRKLTAILTDQRPKAGLLGRLFGGKSHE